MSQNSSSRKKTISLWPMWHRNNIKYSKALSIVFSAKTTMVQMFSMGTVLLERAKLSPIPKSKHTYAARVCGWLTGQCFLDGAA